MRWPGVRLRILHLMGLVALIAAGLAVGAWLDSKPSGWACGAFPLEVALEVPRGRKVVAVAAGCESSLEQVRPELNQPGGPYVDVKSVPWIAGHYFEVSVPCGHQVSMLAHRELSPWQYRALVLRVDYADGDRQWLAQAIPDCQIQRHLSVVIP